MSSSSHSYQPVPTRSPSASPSPTSELQSTAANSPFFTRKAIFIYLSVVILLTSAYYLSLIAEVSSVQKHRSADSQWSWTWNWGNSEVLKQEEEEAEEGNLFDEEDAEPIQSSRKQRRKQRQSRTQEQEEATEEEEDNVEMNIDNNQRHRASRDFPYSTEQVGEILANEPLPIHASTASRLFDLFRSFQKTGEFPLLTTDLPLTHSGRQEMLNYLKSQYLSQHVDTKHSSLQHHVHHILDRRNEPFRFNYTLKRAIVEATNAQKNRVNITVNYPLNECIAGDNAGNGAGEITFAPAFYNADNSKFSSSLPTSFHPSVNSFYLLGHSMAGDTAGLLPALKGRLVGMNGIITMKVEHLNQQEHSKLYDAVCQHILSTTCTESTAFLYRVEYSLHEGGSYLMEIRTNWLKRWNFGDHQGGLTKRAQPYLHTVFRGAIAVSGENSDFEQGTELCSTHHDSSVGRWLPIIEYKYRYKYDKYGALLSEPSRTARILTKQINRAYTISPQTAELVESARNAQFLWSDLPWSYKYITDWHGYSEDYLMDWVWTPLDCIHHLYSQSDLGECSVSCRTNQFLFSGDSMGREMYQNAVQFLDTEGKVILPKIKASTKTHHGNFRDQLDK